MPLRGHMAEFGVIAAIQRRGLGQLIELVENESDSGVPGGDAARSFLLPVQQIQLADRQISDQARAGYLVDVCKRNDLGKGQS